ncbi:MAG TPA: hypothetical protein VG755_02970 [Nannocystaceae bacterium]|nr:hypothetical protein [Nannocystaceae bacterium]
MNGSRKYTEVVDIRWVQWSLLAAIGSAGCFSEGDVTPATTDSPTESSGPRAETSSSTDAPDASSSSEGNGSSGVHGDTGSTSGIAETSTSSTDSSSSSESSSESTSSTTDIPGSSTTDVTDSDPSVGTATSDPSDPSMSSEVGSEVSGGPFFDVGGEDGSFIVRVDLPSIGAGCDPFEQDCPRGEKCMPWADDGGDEWNANRCTPLAPLTGQVGDPCTVEGAATSGIDDCELGAMCWHVDPDTNTGECVGLCAGNEGNPVCADPQTQCVIANAGVLTVCLPTCDPLLQDCAGTDGCFPVSDFFACMPDRSDVLGAFGDPCESFDACDPGLFCAAPFVVPSCLGADGCCSSFCDLNAGDPDAQCAGQAGGQSCLPWYAEGQAPPGDEDIGACAIP